MAKKYVLDAYDKDNGEYLTIARSDSDEDLKRLGENLWQTFGLKNRLNGEPIDWLEISNAKTFDTLWVFDTYEEIWKTTF